MVDNKVQPNREETGNVQQEAEILKSTTAENSEETLVSDKSDEPIDDAVSVADQPLDAHENEQQEEEHEEQEVVDFEQFTIKELAEYVTKLKDEQDMRRLDNVLKQAKAKFDELHTANRQKALNKFLADSANVEEDFEYRLDEWESKFNDYYQLLKERKYQYFKSLEEQKENNLKLKNEILDKIRELVDGEETTISIGAIRKLQDEWKKVGPVPAMHNKTLWASYNALLDRFYDARSIYFELKELDRKKNLEAKLELCEKAEKLDAITNVKQAIQELNELHDEFKHLGPVPQADQETIWQRFKTASDKIYAKRREFSDELKKSLHENLEKKVAIANTIEAFEQFKSDRIADWNAKTKEILELQKAWEAIGGMPREKAKQVNKQFWNGFKKFFAHKNQFFKGMESQRDQVIADKEALIAKAKELAQSSDWDATTKALKQLQEEWKNTGQLPEKERRQLFEQFKKACDEFFERRRAQNSQANEEQETNYKNKQSICDELEKMAKSSSVIVEDALAKIDEYLEIGFVPKPVMKKITTRFDQLVMQLVNHKSLNDDQRTELKMGIEVNRLKGGPNADRKIIRKEGTLRRQIAELEADIHTYRTNMDFLAASKNADKLKQEMEERISKAQQKLNELVSELKVIRQL